MADLENTATNVAQTLENAYYNALNHTIQPELSQPITVSGHPGWEIEYLVNYTNAAAQGATWTTEEGAVVVADTGTGQHAGGVLHVGPGHPRGDQRGLARLLAPAHRGAQRRRRLPHGRRRRIADRGRGPLGPLPRS